MTIFRSEDTLIGLVALALVPWIVWTVRRGIRDNRLPIGRAYVSSDRPAAFGVLLLVYVASGLVAVAMTADLLLNVDLGDVL